jgi:DNA polymerase alpha-associated DNA helicase A
MQLALMSREMKEAFPGIELNSVDGFQGREKEAVILSLVRSNAEKDSGFLAEKRRLNGKISQLKMLRIVLNNCKHSCHD